MVREGKLVYHYNWFDTDRFVVESTVPVPTGEVELAMEFPRRARSRVRRPPWACP